MSNVTSTEVFLFFYLYPIFRIFEMKTGGVFHSEGCNRQTLRFFIVIEVKRLLQLPKIYKGEKGQSCPKKDLLLRYSMIPGDPGAEGKSPSFVHLLSIGALRIAS